MKYDLIVSDYDHTLANTERNVSERNKQAIFDFQKKGGKFMLCTGRMFGSARTVAKRIGLKGKIIAYNGALIGDIESGEIYHHIFLDKQRAIDLLKKLEKESEIVVRVFANDVMYEKVENPKLQIYADTYNVSFVVTHEPLCDYFSKNDINITAIRAIASPQKIIELYEKYRNLVSQAFSVFVSEASLLEFISPLANKGLAVQRYCEENGINRKKIACFGDNYNDIYMIEYAGLGVAVENGVDEIKQKADLVCPPNDSDGVGQIIEKIIRCEL